MNPEEKARQWIDAMLAVSGWAIQDDKALNIDEGQRIAFCETQLQSGRRDYPLIDQRRVLVEVERQLSVIEELEAVVVANLQRVARLRPSVLQRAFSGKLQPYGDSQF